MNAWSWKRTTYVVHEGIGSSHAMGYGIQTSTGYFQASGTSTIENSVDAGRDIGFGHTSRRMTNTVDYRHVQVGCPAPGTQTGVFYRQEVRPYQITAIINQPAKVIPGNQFTDCQIMYRGRPYKHYGSHHSTGGGVSVPQIGSYSTQASFSKDTSITWHVLGKTWVCARAAWTGSTPTKPACTDS
jgi:hypothetical protein